MNTCKTCKHWERWSDEWKGYDKFAGTCNLLGNERSERGDNDNIRVYSDSLPITTEENFGCIHHEENL